MCNPNDGFDGCRKLAGHKIPPDIIELGAPGSPVVPSVNPPLKPVPFVPLNVWRISTFLASVTPGNYLAQENPRMFVIYKGHEKHPCAAKPESVIRVVMGRPSDQLLVLRRSVQ
ncbi:hypothetical protein DFH09DRAFT_1068598 [Mycena vulgaris]|nr:hypothetical protein DFH09DRAFT_1068598 [Mycena vulgaris]